MENRMTQAGTHFISSPWRILGILILISTMAGCVDQGTKLDAGNPTEDTSSNHLTVAQGAEQNASGNINLSKPNQVRLLLRPNELNRSGKLPVTLKITNPRLNETVITVFRPQFGQEWYNQTNITYISNGNWTQNFSIKPKGDTSYVLMFVQISYNNTVVKKAAWNITLGVPVGRPK